MGVPALSLRTGPASLLWKPLRGVFCERTDMNAIRFGTIAVVAVWALATPAGAQTSPSADQIINALKPTEQSLKGPSRGISSAMVPSRLSLPMARSGCWKTSARS